MIHCYDMFRDQQSMSEEQLKAFLAKFDLKDCQGAIAYYNKAIAINSKDAVAYNNRGAVKGKPADNQGAITDYSEAMKIDPQDVFTYNNRGYATWKLKDYQSACNDFKKAASFESQSTVQWLNREDGAWCRNMR
ncbi:Tetratricopeptide repeat [Prochlorococcus marinus str. MIT 1313]|nr:Tetratricopeptide repeat [Prochlorococcus marinus str. MIT 1313]KZR76874.1 Tetratricopeptide repeat [Prochlorococcus marinus str. MIT 1318]